MLVANWLTKEVAEWYLLCMKRQAYHAPIPLSFIEWESYESLWQAGTALGQPDWSDDKAWLDIENRFTAAVARFELSMESHLHNKVHRLSGGGHAGSPFADLLIHMFNYVEWEEVVRVLVTAYGDVSHPLPALDIQDRYTPPPMHGFSNSVTAQVAMIVDNNERLHRIFNDSSRSPKVRLQILLEELEWTGPDTMLHGLLSRWVEEFVSDQELKEHFSGV